MPTGSPSGGPARGARAARPEHPRARRADWEQLIRFCLVGARGYLLNLAVFSLFVHVAESLHVAAVCAFGIAWTNNFVLNKYWTFRRHELPAVQQGARYLR